MWGLTLPTVAINFNFDYTLLNSTADIYNNCYQILKLNEKGIKTQICLPVSILRHLKLHFVHQNQVTGHYPCHFEVRKHMLVRLCMLL